MSELRSFPLAVARYLEEPIPLACLPVPRALTLVAAPPGVGGRAPAELTPGGRADGRIGRPLDGSAWAPVGPTPALRAVEPRAGRLLSIRQVAARPLHGAALPRSVRLVVSSTWQAKQARRCTQTKRSVEQPSGWLVPGSGHEDAPGPAACPCILCAPIPPCRVDSQGGSRHAYASGNV